VIKLRKLFELQNIKWYLTMRKSHHRNKADNKLTMDNKYTIKSMADVSKYIYNSMAKSFIGIHCIPLPAGGS